MNNILSALKIDCYQAIYPLPGAKKSIHCQVFSLQNSSAKVVVVGGLQSSAERVLFEQMLKALGQAIDQEYTDDQWQTETKILIFSVDGRLPQAILETLSHSPTLCYHPAELLTGNNKAQAYQMLVDFFTNIA